MIRAAEPTIEEYDRLLKKNLQKVVELERKVAEFKAALLLAGAVAVRGRILLSSPVKNLSTNAASFEDALNEYDNLIISQANQPTSTTIQQ